MAVKKLLAIFALVQKRVRALIVNFYCNAILKLEAFMMIEASLAVAVLSIVFGSSIVFLLKMQEMHQQTITDRNMWMIIHSIGGFMSRNGRLPYPSMPDMDGLELNHPEDDNEWRNNWREYTRGTVPWRTLGISEYYSKDGKGNYYTYIVDPTLCGRKSVTSVPIGSISESLDWDDDYSKLGAFDELSSGLEFKIWNPDEIIAQNIMRLEQKKYSSYRSVRSYLDDCGYDTGTKTKCWDIASKIKDCKLKVYIDGKEFELPNKYLRVSKNEEWMNTRNLFEKKEKSSVFGGSEDLITQFLPSLMHNWMSENGEMEEESPYRVDDFIALALISHRDKSCCFKNKPNSSDDKGFAKSSYNPKQELNSDATMTVKNRSSGRSKDEVESAKAGEGMPPPRNRVSKGNNVYSQAPNVIYVDSFGGDKVEFIGRFQLADLAGCRCTGFKILLL